MVGLDAEAAAYSNVCNTMLRLARELRRPRNYVGYFAFLVFGLCKQCQPCAWEGVHHINLLGHYAPWGLESCTRECLVDAIPCALVPKAGGLIECSPITEETPLSRMSHYVAGIRIPPQSRDPKDPITFENFYTDLGIMTLPTVCDGDCGLDVMNLMLGLPQCFDTREALRAEMSDYLLERMHEQWMLDMLCVAQELDDDDVALCRRYLSRAAIHPTAVAVDAPTAVAEASAVADPTAVSEPPRRHGDSNHGGRGGPRCSGY